jgi:TRAP-type transport system small permease protein
MSGGRPMQGAEGQGGGAEAAPSLAGPIRLCIAWISAILLCAMMALTVVDVIGRYGFNAPLSGSTEVTELLLSAIIFIGLPAATLDNDHVTVDFLTGRLGSGVERWRVPLVGLFAAAILGVIAWRLWLIGDQISGYGGVTVTLELSIAPAAYLAAALSAISGCVMLVMTLVTLRRA